MRHLLLSIALLPLALAPACGSSKTPTPPAAPQSAGGTGAFGVVTVNGTQKLYLPQSSPNTAGNAIISVVDVGVGGNGVAGAPALITEIALGSSSVATTTSGMSTVVVAASTDNNNVWFIDPRTDTLIKTIQLDDSYGRSGFSGGGGYVTGIAMDPAHNRAILSVWNGFAILDLASQSIKQVIQAPPSENFGFDVANERIVAPFYDCGTSLGGAIDGGSGGPPPFCGQYKASNGAAMTDGLNVIDLKDGTVYTYQNPSATDPTAPVGHEPDSAAADPNTGIVVVPAESEGFQSIIDLSKATFDKATKTVTAPEQTMQGNGLTGIAIEAANHYAFWEEESASDVSMADLGNLGIMGASSNFAHALMPSIPGGTNAGWSNLGDPHGIAVTTGIADGHPIGIVVDSGGQWVARIDLAAMWALPRSTGAAGATEISDMDMAKVVTMLDAKTKK